MTWICMNTLAAIISTSASAGADVREQCVLLVASCDMQT